AQKIYAQLLSLRVSQIPVADLDSIQPGPVENIVSIVQADRLLDRPDIDARQPLDGLREMAVGTGIVHGPVGHALGTVRVRQVGAEPDGRIHQPAKDPLRRMVVALRKREVVILPTRVLAKGLLNGVRRAQQRDTGDYVEKSQL